MDMLEFERKYWQLNFKHLAGIDEAGRGPLAGPVIASAVIFPKEIDLPEVTDSKKLTEKKRERLFNDICNKALAIGVGIVHEEEIDEKNILQATYIAMRKSIEKLSIVPDLLLIDGNTADIKYFKQKSIINGDQKSLSIAAASIIAKVTRDKMMKQYDIVFPGYGFAQHKGYGTKQHMEKIHTKKATMIHRKSFNPIANHLPNFAFLKRHNLIEIVGLQLVACHFVRLGNKIIEFDYLKDHFSEIHIISMETSKLIFTKVNTFLDMNYNAYMEHIVKLNDHSKFIKNIKNYIENNELNYEYDFRIAKVLLGQGKPIIKFENENLIKNKRLKELI